MTRKSALMWTLYLAVAAGAAVVSGQMSLSSAASAAGAAFTTSSELRALVSDPTGTGAAVFGTNPSLAGVTFSQMSSLSVTRTTMSATLTLTTASSNYHSLDPNGSDRVVTLPSEVAGQFFSFRHVGSANTITIDFDDGTDVTTLVAGEGKSVLYDGTTWVVW